jgi:hypothetical protein
MIVSRLQGGLGNQMFQYACARNLAVRFGTNVVFDLTDLLDERLRLLHTPRDYELGYFKLSQSFAKKENLSPFNAPPRGFARLLRYLRPCPVLREKTLCFDPELIGRARKQTLLIGYWPSEKYFSAIGDILRQDFQLNRALSDQARKTAGIVSRCEAIGVHIRRGDYVENKAAQSFHGTCSPGYYENAMQYIASRVRAPVFLVFSDDADWCRKHFSAVGETIFVEPSGVAAEDMHLISLCRHQIIANSSFSWWGAWLNPDAGKIVIAPRPWISGPSESQPDIYPQGWIVFDR